MAGFSTEPGRGFVDMKLNIYLGNEIINSYDMNQDKSVIIKEDFELEIGQPLMGKLIETDEKGFTYESIAFKYVGGEPKLEGDYGLNEKIMAPNGTVIYDYDANRLY